MDFDGHWKLKAIEIAVAEQLEELGYIDIKTVFRRAKFLYNQGYMKGLDDWDSAFKENHEEEKVEVVEDKKPLKGYKICPKCQEEIPVTWQEHKYKKIGGEECGYKW